MFLRTCVSGGQLGNDFSLPTTTNRDKHNSNATTTSALCAWCASMCPTIDCILPTPLKGIFLSTDISPKGRNCLAHPLRPSAVRQATLHFLKAEILWVEYSLCISYYTYSCGIGKLLFVRKLFLDLLQRVFHGVSWCYRRMPQWQLK